ncbi:hypothetical protein LRC39_15170 [Rhodopseudomonas sp. P1]|uniref:hypothetical protein n=1 Tax=Rhodopseudomonas sp. P1 TaxID=3434357 RepID=UPI0031FDF223
MTDGSDDLNFEPEFEPYDPRRWSVNLSFWRPSQLSDAEMQAFFVDRDGRWSAQTKAAIERFNAKGLDLNQSWALVEQRWLCPVCQRFKADIFRVSSRGILLANLEEHHDHFRDYVGSRGRELFGERWVLDLPSSGATMVDTLESLVSTFPRELVCSECNAADGKAKLALKDMVPPYFSFAPTEIRGFIQPSPNADHKVDLKKAEAIWRQLEPSLKARVDLVDNALHMIQSGALHRERGTSSLDRAWRRFEPQLQLYAEFLNASNRDGRGRELNQATTEFLARSVQKDSNILAPRTQPKRAKVQEPSDEEYSTYNDPVSPKRWQNTNEEWFCPVCKRRKRQIVRKSGSGKWAGGIRDLYEAVEETSQEGRRFRRMTLPRFSHAFIMREARNVQICSDCAEIIPQLKARRRDLTDVSLTCLDLLACIQSLAPHASHVVDWDEAGNRASANRQIAPAWDAYFKHRALASRIQNLYKRFLRFENEASAIREVTEEVMYVAEIDELDEASILARWLLDEAARFDQEEENNKREYLASKAASKPN